MTKGSDNPFPSILIEEGAEPSAPAAGHQRLYIDSSTHHLSRTDSGGTEVDLETSGGDVATDAIWDAAGDLAVGTGADTAGRLAIGGAYGALRVKSDASTLEWLAASTAWTPVVKQGNQTPAMTHNCQVARLGPLVLADGVIAFTGAGQAGQSVLIEGFPFTPRAGSQAPIGTFLYYDSGTTFYHGTAFYYLNGATVEIRFHVSSNNGEFGAAPAVTIANGDNVRLCLAFLVA